MYDELWQWREEHPQTSFDEIAAQVTPRRRAVMAEMLKALAGQHGLGQAVEGQVCPGGGGQEPLALATKGHHCLGRTQLAVADQQRIVRQQDHLAQSRQIGQINGNATAHCSRAMAPGQRPRLAF